jgi:CBS domain-containing protein
MKVHEIMTTRARCVGPENTLVEAAGLMRQLDIGAVPVCEEDRLLGMLTDRDIAVRAVADGRDPNTTIVRDVMSHGIIHVWADQEVEEVVRLMENKKIRRVPVLNRGKRLVGIVALGDIAVTSNPAFSGLALREVSESEQTLANPRARAAAASRPPSAALRLSAGRNGSTPHGEDGRHQPREEKPRRSRRQSRRSRTGAGAQRKTKRSATRQTRHKATGGKRRSRRASPA